MSLPSRERGLKSDRLPSWYSLTTVAPLAGAGIEIPQTLHIINRQIVAPLAGAWIEIQSLIHRFWKSKVAPLAGAWIEIKIKTD